VAWDQLEILKENSMKLHLRLGAVLLALAAIVPLAARAQAPGEHPAYLHALADLRAARWLIWHHPGDWAQSVDERDAIRHIDDAIRELKEAAYDDGKNTEFHPQIDERPDEPGRLHQAVDILRKARSDVAREEDNAYARGLRNRSLGHIDAAIHRVRRAIHDE
jgi:hypothetical protein